MGRPKSFLFVLAAAAWLFIVVRVLNPEIHSNAAGHTQVSRHNNTIESKMGNNATTTTTTNKITESNNNPTEITTAKTTTTVTNREISSDSSTTRNSNMRDTTANQNPHMKFTWMRHEPRLRHKLRKGSKDAQDEDSPAIEINTTCAILLYGLPRKFREFTLLSLKKNVIPYNPDCDYFVHYYDVVGSENGDRFETGRRGFLNATEILELTDVVHDMTTTDTVVKYEKTTVAEFHKMYDSFLHKLRVERFNDTGKLVYWPTREDYTNVTVSNIVKMWHSLQSVWNLMKEESARSGKSYETVAMLRSDVLFVTKLNFRAKPASVGREEPFAVVPAFAKFPVNDRMIYGDARGVEIWANQRFQRLDQHCLSIRTRTPENCMDDENYLDSTLFPAMRQERQISIVEQGDICFLRVRSDSLVRFDDCGYLSAALSPAKENNQRVVEEIMERTCLYNQTGFHASLECSGAETKS